MNNDIRKYVCDEHIENYFQKQNLDESAKNIGMIFKNLKSIQYEYDLFINDLELFFNHHISSPDDLNQIEGELFELSDESERIFFPFKKIDGQLKFVETDAGRVAIMTAIASTKLEKINKDNKEQNEQYIITQL